ncbi:hypothetical protein ECANGB1_2682 [Enterospora canceri]|uniref:Uncharacterized protein n=1 Tax=Enterospora canceri TaxID=1081671 RepID=A0A1Y1S9N9_9MICR|nr:hypothetical protein ECANGB1_2682 [Enterospora canceri]
MLLWFIDLVLSAARTQLLVNVSHMHLLNNFTAMIIMPIVSYRYDIDRLNADLESKYNEFISLTNEEKGEIIKRDYDEFLNLLKQIDKNKAAKDMDEYENNMVYLGTNCRSLEMVEAKYNELSESFNRLKKANETLHNQQLDFMNCRHYFVAVKQHYRMCQNSEEVGDDDSLDIEHFYSDESRVSSDNDLIEIFKNVDNLVSVLINIEKLLKTLRKKKTSLITDFITTLTVSN